MIVQTYKYEKINGAMLEVTMEIIQKMYSFVYVQKAVLSVSHCTVICNISQWRMCPPPSDPFLHINHVSEAATATSQCTVFGEKRSNKLATAKGRDRAGLPPVQICEKAILCALVNMPQVWTYVSMCICVDMYRYICMCVHVHACVCTFVRAYMRMCGMQCTKAHLWTCRITCLLVESMYS